MISCQLFPRSAGLRLRSLFPQPGPAALPPNPRPRLRKLLSLPPARSRTEREKQAVGVGGIPSINRGVNERGTGVIRWVGAGFRRSRCGTQSRGPGKTKAFPSLPSFASVKCFFISVNPCSSVVENSFRVLPMKQFVFISVHSWLKSLLLSVSICVHLWLKVLPSLVFIRGFSLVRARPIFRGCRCASGCQGASPGSSGRDRMWARRATRRGFRRAQLP